MTASNSNSNVTNLWSQTNMEAAGHYAPVNGVNLYYEVHGSGGTPLILIHGGLGMVGMFAPIMPTLAETRQVVGVELQGHGHTADIDRPFSFESMADDVAALIKHLGLESADVLGYSLGGAVALQTVIRHPEVVRKLVVISAAFKRNAWYPGALAGMDAMNADAARFMIGSPPHQAYVAVAPVAEGWISMVSKTGDLLRKDYDWSAGVKGIKSPTLFIVADADAIRLDVAIEMYRLLGGGPAILTADGRMDEMPASQLAVLPGTSHYNILERADLLLPILPIFLDAPMRERAAR